MKVLILTTLDVLGRQNNREHHLIAHWSSRADLTVVTRGRRRAGDPASARGSTTEETRGGTRYIRVIAPLTPPDGLVRSTSEGKASRLSALRGQALDSAAVLRDALTIHALRAAARPHVDADTLVLALGPWATLAAAPLRKRLLVYTDRDYEPGFALSPARRRFAAWAESRAARRADLTLTIGARLGRRLTVPVGRGPVLSPTGIDLARIPARAAPVPVRRLIHVGEIAPWSGVEEAIAALPALPGTELHAIGPVSETYRRRLTETAARHGLADRLVLPGNLPRADLLARLGAGGIGFAVFRPHPLRIHAAPLKILEYMAAGLPVIALTGSEAGDTVRISGAGLTCGCIPAEIAEATGTLLSDPARWAAAAHAGHRFAGTRDWGDILAREEEVIRTHLAARTPGAPRVPKAAFLPGGSR